MILAPRSLCVGFVLAGRGLSFLPPHHHVDLCLGFYFLRMCINHRFWGFLLVCFDFTTLQRVHICAIPARCDSLLLFVTLRGLLQQFFQIVADDS